MANNLSAFTPEYWSARTQRLLKTKLISREIANFEEQSTLRDGDMVHRPYYSDVVVNDYTKGVDVTVQDVAATDEYLTVNKSKEVTVYIDAIDVKQNKYDAANKYIDRMTYALKKDIDGSFLKEVLNANYTVDDAVVSGGTAGDPVTVTVSNAFKMFTLTEAMMNANDIEDTKAWFYVITPEVKAAIQQTNLVNGFNQADAALRGVLKGVGYLGTWGNFNIFVSNNIAHTNKVTMSSVAAADTLTINGVTITFKAAPAAAGECKPTLAALKGMINGVMATAGDYVDFSAADRAKLIAVGASAIDDGTDVTVVTNGHVTYAQSGVTLGGEVANCWAGQYGCTDLVIQKDVEIQKNKEPKKTGYNYLAWTLYGVKTFTEGKKRCIKVLVAA
jgi:hypothetical protein